MAKRQKVQHTRASVRISIGRSGQRLTLSRHGVTISLGRSGSGLHTIWQRSWHQIWGDIARARLVRRVRRP